MRLVALGALVTLSLVSTSVIAQPKYGPGTSATEIKVGQTIA
jgi:branched-chain amino acid transport system substrate-binding protein